MPDAELLAYLQDDGFRHADLDRRARRCHERKLRGGRACSTPPGGDHGDWAAPPRRVRGVRGRRPVRPRRRVPGPREGPAVPVRDSAPLRVALVADGLGATHGVARTLEQIRERGVPGLRGRGDRHRRVRRPAPDLGRGGRDAVLPRADGRHPRPPGGRRGARRRPLRPAARVLARPGGIAARADRAGCSACRSPAPTTPSWPPTRACGPATRGLAVGMTARARGVLRPVRPRALPVRARTPPSARSASTPARIGRWDRGVDLARFSPSGAPSRSATRSTCCTPAA